MPTDETRTDNEILSSFMEAKPELGPFDFRPWRGTSPGGWWKALPHSGQDQAPNEWYPVLDVCPGLEKLGRLRLIEERLSEEQWAEYINHLPIHKPLSVFSDKELTRMWKSGIHASAKQKSAALASVLREQRS